MENGQVMERKVMQVETYPWKTGGNISKSSSRRPRAKIVARLDTGQEIKSVPRTLRRQVPTASRLHVQRDHPERFGVHHWMETSGGCVESLRAMTMSSSLNTTILSRCCCPFQTKPRFFDEGHEKWNSIPGGLSS